MGGDLLRAEGAGVLLLVEELDASHTDVVVVEEELVGVVEGVTELDTLADVGGRDLVEGALEADGGIVIDDALMADEEDLVELGLGEPPDLDAAEGGVVAVDGFFIDSVVELVVVVVAEPEAEGLVELVKGDALPDAGEEAVADGEEVTFHLAARRAVIGLGVGEGDAGQGGGLGEEVRGEAGAVVHVEALGDAAGEEGLLEDEAEGADGLGGAEGVAHDDTGVVVDNGAEDGLGGAVLVGGNAGPVHEVADPEVVDVFHLVGLSPVGAALYGEPAVVFDDPEKRIVVDRGVSQEVLVPEGLVELLHGEVGIGLALDLDGFEQGIVEAPGPSAVGTGPGLEGVEAALAVLGEPGLHGGDGVPPQAVAGEVVLDGRLLAEVLVLGPGGLGEHRADDLVALEGDLLSDFFVHDGPLFSVG